MKKDKTDIGRPVLKLVCTYLTYVWGSSI